MSELYVQVNKDRKWAGTKLKYILIKSSISTCSAVLHDGQSLPVKYINYGSNRIHDRVNDSEHEAISYSFLLFGNC